MKFSCSKINLERALMIAERFTGKNVTLPILGNILIEVVDTYSTITATNLEYAVQIKLQGAEIDEGKVSVGARIMSAAIQSIEDEKITLEAKQKNLFIKTATQEIRVNGMPPEDFPLLPKIKFAAYFLVSRQLFQRSIEEVLPAVATSEFKPELCGVYVSVSKKNLTLVATDTFRLNEKTIPLEKESPDSFSFIVPHRVMQEFARINGSDEVAKISYGENQWLIESGDTKIISRLIEGAFPNYASVIPRKFNTTAFVPRNDLMRSLRASSIFVSKLQDVTLKFKESRIEVSSANADVGEYHTTIPAAISGDAVSVTFNYRYLLDSVSVMSEDEIYFGLNGENSPTLIRNKSNEALRSVVMPIRLTS